MRRKVCKTQQPTAIDIFSGSGGLTVGLKKAGFRVVAAVEIEPHAFATYKANHPEVQAYKQDVRTVRGKSLIACSPSGEIDLLSGCPPCQGFSSLTARHKRPDPRNELVLEMSRLVEEIQPRIVMMENVPGLPKKGTKLFEQLLQKLESLGYISAWDILQVADYGVPQSRQRLVLLAGKGFPVHLPKPTHSKTGKDGLKPWRTLRDAIGTMPEPIVLADTHTSGGPQRYNWHVVRSLAPDTLKILKAARPGESRLKLPEELRPPCHQNRSDGFNNVYGRLSWDQISSTITGGCTTVSKGRFGHPEQDRTISVREAALLQTFPMDYIFDTPYIDYVCEMIGNALPCDFAEVLARQCLDALSQVK
ncbi:DNA cytosine methyltransferase [Oscillatoria sp. FACHB-1407]|uniref:DNA cytosine methyltransferase n=1 Tax=Oscillatoria sp. FACHB-1407 TaxID=2692847 RepID=UPI001687C46C|nr:DNA cytosine methyltransferase [Oscillatoria sp. FACHB-1407]MBD2459461.1 DNA cytosine methyltransferase [Oscillatoria sp. FACHB-1407]